MVVVEHSEVHGIRQAQEPAALRERRQQHGRVVVARERGIRVDQRLEIEQGCAVGRAGRPKPAEAIQSGGEIGQPQPRRRLDALDLDDDRRVPLVESARKLAQLIHRRPQCAVGHARRLNRRCRHRRVDDDLVAGRCRRRRRLGQQPIQRRLGLPQRHGGCLLAVYGSAQRVTQQHFAVEIKAKLWKLTSRCWIGQRRLERRGRLGVEPLPETAALGDRSARGHSAGRIPMSIWLSDRLPTEKGQPAPRLDRMQRCRHLSRKPETPRYPSGRGTVPIAKLGFGALAPWSASSMFGRGCPDTGLLVEDQLLELALRAVGARARQGYDPLQRRHDRRVVQAQRPGRVEAHAGLRQLGQQRWCALAQSSIP